MKPLLLALALLLLTCQPALAKPLEPDGRPRWLTDECVQIVARIVSHEIGHGTRAQKTFVAHNVLLDARRLGCRNLTQWRWKIGSYFTISTGVMGIVLSTPNGRRCRFVGSRSDVAIWRAAGYRARVDVELSGNGLTVIGADCDQSPIDSY